MRKIVLTAVGAALIAMAGAQVASAAGRHQARHVTRAPTAEQFRNANNAVAWPTQSPYGDRSEPSEAFGGATPYVGGMH
jgi:hypothetical protein